MKNTLRKQWGGMLIEVAVSLFVLSVGLLGLASLQFMSLKNMNMAQKSDLASTYLQRIAEVMRENPDQASTFMDMDGGVSAGGGEACQTACDAETNAKSRLGQIKAGIYQHFDQPELKIKETEMGRYDIKTEKAVVGGIETVEEKHKIALYLIELSWKESGNFVLRNDVNHTQKQSLRVALDVVVK